MRVGLEGSVCMGEREERGGMWGRISESVMEEEKEERERGSQRNMSSP